MGVTWSETYSRISWNSQLRFKTEAAFCAVSKQYDFALGLVIIMGQLGRYSLCLRLLESHSMCSVNQLILRSQLAVGFFFFFLILVS